MFKKNSLYIIGIVALLGAEFTLRDVFLPKDANEFQILLTVLVEWLILLALLILWIPKVENGNLAQIGIAGFKFNYIWLSIPTYILLFIVWAIFSFGLNALGLEGLRSLQPKIKELSLFTRFALLLTGTFYEEIVYRGYLMERLTSLTGKMWIAGLISWIAFTLVHLRYFGLGPTLDVGVLSAALVFLYIKERSIWPCVLLHGLNDVFGFFIGPMLVVAA
jgi:membrane protease YdiL (CAAX protease family)